MPAIPPEPTPHRSPRSEGERRNVRGEATRQRIILAAEELFAERGVAAAALRDIGIAAGQRNHAAVQYHFGDRLELVRAVLEMRGAESELSRTAVVADLVLQPTPPSIADIVDAFIRPLAIHLRDRNHYLAFLSRLIIEEGGYEGIEALHVRAGASVGTLRTLLGRLVPELAVAILDERWSLTETSAVHALARYQSALRKRQRPTASLDVLLTDLAAYLSAGIVARVENDDPRRM